MQKSLIPLFNAVVVVLVGIYALPASGRTVEECVAALQNNKEQIAAAGQTESSFLEGCLKASPKGRVTGSAKRVNQGSVIAPNQPAVIPNTVGGIVTMSR
jgi:hypothetical protein